MIDFTDALDLLDIFDHRRLLCCLVIAFIVCAAAYVWIPERLPAHFPAYVFTPALLIGIWWEVAARRRARP